MPVYDPANPVSAEGNSLWSLADLMADCTAFRTLTETSSSAAARLCIQVGPSEKPWDNDRYSEDELANIFCGALLMSPMESEKTVSIGDSAADPYEGGLYEMQIRYYIRKSERENMDGVYLWFLDNIAALEKELLVDAELAICPRLRDVARIMGPALGARDEVSTQGEYYWTVHAISWGDELE